MTSTINPVAASKWHKTHGVTAFYKITLSPGITLWWNIQHADFTLIVNTIFVLSSINRFTTSKYPSYHSSGIFPNYKRHQLFMMKTLIDKHITDVSSGWQQRKFRQVELPAKHSPSYLPHSYYITYTTWYIPYLLIFYVISLAKWNVES